MKQLKQYVLDSRKDKVFYDLEENEPVVLRVSLDEFHLESMFEAGIKIDDVLDNIKKYSPLETMFQRKLLRKEELNEK